MWFKYGLKAQKLLAQGIATTVRSSFRLKSVSNPRKAVKVPFIPRNPMNNDTPSFSWCYFFYSMLRQIGIPFQLVSNLLTNFSVW